jgi:hypothetical protein
MVWTERHVSDERLVLLAGGDLSRRRAVRAQRHLDACPACRRRKLDIEALLAGLSHDGEPPSDAALPSAAPARARLHLRMAECAEERRSWLPAGHAPVTWTRRWLYASAVFAFVAFGVVFSGRTASHERASTDDVVVAVVPRRDLTPGLARVVALDEICGPSPGARAHAVPATVQRTVFESYGADYGRAAEYELDYLITPELGGIAEAGNLWPQRFAGTQWNAYVKDELEQFLHRRVCGGAIELAVAQRDMADDWIASYKRHFQTDRPLRDYSRAPLAAGDAGIVLAELRELGVSPPPLADGSALVAMLHAARTESLGRLTATH